MRLKIHEKRNDADAGCPTVGFLVSLPCWTYKSFPFSRYYAGRMTCLPRRRRARREMVGKLEHGSFRLLG